MEFLISLLIAIALILINFQNIHNNKLFNYLFLFWALANLFLSALYTIQNFNIILLYVNSFFLIIYIILLLLIVVFRVFVSLKEKYEEIRE